MSTYVELLAKAIMVLERYSLAAFIRGFTPVLINQLMLNHIDKVRQANSYDTTFAMLNTAASTQLGVQTTVDKFIAKKEDRGQLYEIFQAWRMMFLSDTDGFVEI
jgi:hypothetical protein